MTLKLVQPADAAKPDEWDYAASLAVIAANKGAGVVLWTVGPHVQRELDVDRNELSSLGLDDAPDGISIWVGWYIGNGEGEDMIMEPKGSFRPPTEDEWAAIIEGRCPWTVQPKE